MRIGIMTMHRGNSYGSNLQAFALKTFLETCYQAQVEFIDFYPDDSEKNMQIGLSGKSLKLLMKKILYYRDNIAFQRKQKLFDVFTAKYFTRSRRFKTLEALYSNPPLYELYVSGSDQVFRVNKTGENYLANYLDFCPEGAKKIAYAGSFGQEIIPESRRERVSKLFKEFASLSCRELDGCRLIESLIGGEVPFVMDPVNLLDKDQWRQFAAPVTSLEPGFILVYAILSHEYVGDIAQRVKELTGKQLVVLDTSVRSNYKADAILYDVSPEQFIWLVDNSSFVVTNSFHGTSFSVIFRKSFFSYRIKAPGFITRSKDLLESIGLSDRIIDSPGSIEVDKLAIDYSKLEAKILKRIQDSKLYLDTATKNLLRAESLEGEI